MINVGNQKYFCSREVAKFGDTFNPDFRFECALVEKVNKFGFSTLDDSLLSLSCLNCLSIKGYTWNMKETEKQLQARVRNRPI